MVECPVCHTGIPEGARACVRCATPVPLGGETIVMGADAGETQLDLSEAATIAPDPGATLPGDAPTGWSVPIQRVQQPQTDPSAALSPGDVLGERYEIIKLLGEGGMGAVYKASDRELDRLVALKVIRPELASNPEILKRFKQELILARQVTHKNVIRIFDLGVADGRKFITMDFVEGRDLKSILVERGKFAPQDAVDIITQTARGLEAAHNVSVIHRDLKPQNIMVDGQGGVWVMDFGLARSLETAGMTRTGALMGTPDYMSPEQARADKADARSDLFTLGIIFYELLTGKLPFQADTLMATLLKRTREKATPPREIDPGVPQALSDIVMKCLETNPDRRYQSVGALLQDLASPTGSQSSVMANAPLSFDPGSDFGPRYRIEKLIGEGGMGKVYRAHDKDLDRTVALKLVRTEFASDPNSMQRFKQELLLASKISHKNVLRIHDLGYVNGVKFISMAYVEGRDLHELMQEAGRMEVKRAVHFMVQMCQALEAAHNEGVVHRDLKPRNVLVDKDDQIYVSDFGLAKSLEAEASTMTRAGEVLGTPRYMSPEQAESKPADARSDIYSLGLILYEMVTEVSPFPGESTLQVMYQRVTQKPKSPKLVNPTLPDYLVEIIMRCLEKEPEERYQHAREIWRDLDYGVAPKRSLLSHLSRKKWFVAAAAVIILVVSVAAIPQARERALLLLANVLPTRESITSPAKQKYLAVLPFRIVGDDASLKLTAEGMVESLSAKLFQLKDVYMASPALVEKVNPADPPEKIAKKLGVKMLVQGTVQGNKDKISVVVNLYDIATQKRIFSQQFEGVPQDLLTIQDQIYSKLVDSMDVKRSTEEMALGASRPTESVDAYQLYLRGRNAMRGPSDVKHLNDAIVFYNQAIKGDSRFALAYAGLADASLDMYDLTKDSLWTEKALGAAKQALRLNEKLPEVHFVLGSVYRETGKTNESIAELKRALELAPNSDDAYRRLGYAYLAIGRKEEAIQAELKAVQVNPYYFLNYNYLGQAYLETGESEKAIEQFKKVVDLEPDNASGYINLGAAYISQGHWNDSIAPLQKAQQLEPSQEAFGNLGVAQFYLGKYHEAVQSFEKAVALNPNQQQAVGNLADAYRWDGQKDKAVATYGKAIELALKANQVNPNDASILGSLAEYSAKKGDYGEAQRWIQRARGIDPNDNSLIYKAALVNALAGQKEAALQSLREAFQKNFSVTEAMNDPELKELRADPAFTKLAAEFSSPKTKKP